MAKRRRLPAAKPGHNLEATMRDQFERDCSELFEGMAEGQYLRNRLTEAWMRGLEDGQLLATTRITRRISRWIVGAANDPAGDKEANDND